MQIVVAFVRVPLTGPSSCEGCGPKGGRPATRFKKVEDNVSTVGIREDIVFVEKRRPSMRHIG